MKKRYIPIFLTLFAISLCAQVRHEVILSKDYDKLPFDIRIENSGIYGVSDFDVLNGVVELSEFDAPVKHLFRENKLMKSLKDNNHYSINSSKISGLSQKETTLSSAKKIFKSSAGSLKKGSEYPSLLSSAKNVKIIRESKSELSVEIALQQASTSFTINFDEDLAFGELIGIDRSGNIFLGIERYLSEVPLKVKREVYVCDFEGKTLSKLELPDVKYLYTINDLQIDAEGNLYHLFSNESHLEVIKWSGLTSKTTTTISYPKQYDYSLHYNYKVPVKENVTTLSPAKTNGKVSRLKAMKIGESYVYHQYYCTEKNLAPEEVTAADGDIVKTSQYLNLGYNARVPYKWGGFNTIAQFDEGLKNGKFAGDKHTQGVSREAVGVDCSGFVSRCWELSTHYGTSMMPGICTKRTNWDIARPGDAVLKSGHVRLFVAHKKDGSILTVEASSRDWAVSYWTFKPSDLTAYAPYSYTGLADEHNERVPEIESTISDASENITITWNCDTSSVIGYRLYKSSDNINWTVIKNETELTDTFFVDETSDSPSYYRVSSVIPYHAGKAESNWSNLMGVGNPANSSKALIVDGYDRTEGSWRGPGHTFAAKYGNILDSNNVNFITVDNSLLINGTINANDFDAIYWLLGDESTYQETFDSDEQRIVREYLEQGGNLFVSGSEIAWDLDYKGSSEDKAFYNDYLKASYKSDEANSNKVVGVENSAVGNGTFYIGKTYIEDYPDVIAPTNGGTICMKYSDGTCAGVQYSGNFSSSSVTGKIVYLAFPLETTADDKEFNKVITSTLGFFKLSTDVEDNSSPVNEYNLDQNYPNPFNPTTNISFSIKERGTYSLKVFNTLGQEVATLFNKEMEPGKYSLQFNGANLASGTYFYRLQSDGFTAVKKMILVK